MAKNNSVFESIKVGLILLLICALTAGVVSFVQVITKDPIEANLAAEKTKAVGVIFGSEGITTKELTELPEGATGCFEVRRDDVLAGYCVSVAPQGYAGAINMMVGVAPDGKIIGVEITSMTESGDLQMGNRNTLLDRFVGKESSEGVDGKAGATYSSKAVMAGVDSAIAALKEMKLIGGEG